MEYTNIDTSYYLVKTKKGDVFRRVIGTSGLKSDIQGILEDEKEFGKVLEIHETDKDGNILKKVY